MHWVGELKIVTDNCVAHLVVGGDELLLLAHHSSLLFGPCDHAHDALFELDLSDLLLTCAGCEQRCLVNEVGEVGTGETWGLTGQSVDGDLFRQRLATGVDSEDLGAAPAIGAINHDLAVETAGAQQRWVEHVGPVCGSNQDDVVFCLEPVHLDK